MDVEKREIDVKEEERVLLFSTEGCGCHKLCWKQFSAEHYGEMRNNMAQLEHDALDLVIMGQKMAGTTVSNKKIFTHFYHHGKSVSVLHIKCCYSVKIMTAFIKGLQEDISFSSWN